MRRIWITVPLIILALLGRSPAFAGESSDWVVRKATGVVEYSMLGAEGVVVEEGDLLAPGMGLETGDNGRVRLERGEEWLVVLPNTVVTVVAEPDAGMDTTLKVETGTIGVHVQKQSSQHFSVSAPNLVAVVKGTTFSVNATGEQSKVGVIEGLVEVRSVSSQEVRDIQAGEVASVGTDGGAISVNSKQSDSGTSTGDPVESELEIFKLITDDGVQPTVEPEKSKGKKKGKSKKNYSGTSGHHSYHGNHSHDKGRGKRK